MVLDNITQAWKLLSKLAGGQLVTQIMFRVFIVSSNKCTSIYIHGSVSEKMKIGYIYKKLLKSFTFESLKLRKGLSYQLPISNTSCHTSSLNEIRFLCLTLAPCRRYKAQYPEGFKIQVAHCRNVQITSKSICT